MSTKSKQETDPATLTESDFSYMTQVVEEIRTEEGLGGQCGFVAEILAGRYGWEMYGGIYHSVNGRPIGDHMWNVHTLTGTIIDATADQFGEGAQVRVIAPSDPLQTRYRYAETDEQEAEWLDTARRSRDANGGYWWVAGGTTNPDVVAYEARVAVWESWRLA